MFKLTLKFLVVLVAFQFEGAFARRLVASTSYGTEDGHGLTHTVDGALDVIDHIAPDPAAPTSLHGRQEDDDDNNPSLVVLHERKPAVPTPGLSSVLSDVDNTIKGPVKKVSGVVGGATSRLGKVLKKRQLYPALPTVPTTGDAQADDVLEDNKEDVDGL